MVKIEHITAGLLLKEFITEYSDHPFGEQGLVLTKQLLDLAFPGQPLKSIINSTELIEMMNEFAFTLYFWGKIASCLKSACKMRLLRQGFKKERGKILKEGLAPLLNSPSLTAQSPSFMLPLLVEGFTYPTHPAIVALWFASFNPFFSNSLS